MPFLAEVTGNERRLLIRHTTTGYPKSETLKEYLLETAVLTGHTPAKSVAGFGGGGGEGEREKK